MTDEAKALAKAIRKEVCNCHICGLCGWKPKRAADLIETQAREIERLRRDKRTLLDFARAIKTWRQAASVCA